MTKKADFYGVFCNGESEPRALFMVKGDAVTYDYVRFGDPQKEENIVDKTHEVVKVSLPSKSSYSSLPFQEGLAFNRVMRMRTSLFKGGVR